MKNVKLFKGFVLVLTLLILGSAGVTAKSQDVTSKMKNKSGVKSICKYINMYVQVAVEPESASWKKTDKMDMNNKAKITCLAIRGVGNNVFDYEDRYKDLYFAIRKKSFKSIYKKLFGSDPHISKIKFSSRTVVKRNGKFYTTVGDWSEGGFPVYSIKKVTRTGSKTYTILMKNMRKNYDEDSRYTIGITNVKIKASKRSSNGFIVTGISYNISGPLYQ